MEYAVRSKDRTQALFVNVETGDLFALNADFHENTMNKLFRTDSRDKAYEAWQMTGGDYGEFEVVLE